MTTVDVIYRYATHPTEANMFALGKAREVYGIRRLSISRQDKTIQLEYDATRLSPANIAQLLRGAGISIMEEVSLIPPQLSPVAAEGTKDLPLAR